MVKRSWLLIAALPLSISPSWGADFYYRQQEKGTVYVVEQKGEKDEILSELPDINFSRLWRIANLANKQDSRLLSDFPDKFDCDDEGDCEHVWLTDGRSVLWSGKVLKIPPVNLKSTLPVFRHSALSLLINAVSILTVSVPMIDEVDMYIAVSQLQTNIYVPK